MRIEFALVVVFSLAALPSKGDGAQCNGKDRWPVKTGVAMGAINADTLKSARAVSVAELLKLPWPEAVQQLKKADQKVFDQKAHSNLIPSSSGDAIPEGTIVKLSGWLHQVGHDSNDSDYHIQIVAHQPPNCANNAVIVEIPDDYCVVNPALTEPALKARNSIDTLLGHEPPLKDGDEPPKPTRITVTGALFFDLHHTAQVNKEGPGGGRGHGACPAGTLWEVHPVIAVQLNDSPETFAENLVRSEVHRLKVLHGSRHAAPQWVKLMGKKPSEPEE
jgi:hypothetical protein